MKKEKVEEMFDVLDTVFNDINTKNKKLGTGLQFNYLYNVLPGDKKLDKPVSYTIDIKLREAGHGERVLQTLVYHKPKSYDLNTMKYQVIVSVITLMFESTMLQWNELGKLLNTDPSLQKAAIIV